MENATLGGGIKLICFILGIILSRMPTQGGVEGSDFKEIFHSG